MVYGLPHVSPEHSLPIETFYIMQTDFTYKFFYIIIYGCDSIVHPLYLYGFPHYHAQDLSTLSIPACLISPFSMLISNHLSQGMVQIHSIPNGLPVQWREFLNLGTGLNDKRCDVQACCDYPLMSHENIPLGFLTSQVIYVEGPQIIPRNGKFASFHKCVRNNVWVCGV